jgi:hypothetical protein
MSIKLRILATLLVGIPAAFTVVGLTASGAIAQEDAAPSTLFRPRETPQEAMEREFFDHEKSTLNSQTFGGKAAAAGQLIGVPRYSENGIIQDAASVHRLYRYLLEQQTYSNPTMRAADLPSPFTTSVQFLPTNGYVTPGSSSEIPSFERPTMPNSGPAPFAPAPSPAPGPAPSVMPDPVPAPRLPIQGKL